jgi:hypothetical protein
VIDERTVANDTVSVFLGPHRLATFDADGQQMSPGAPEPGNVLAICTIPPSLIAEPPYSTPFAVSTLPTCAYIFLVQALREAAFNILLDNLQRLRSAGLGRGKADCWEACC